MSKHSIVRWIKMIGVYLLVAAVAALGWLWCVLPEQVYLEPDKKKFPVDAKVLNTGDVVHSMEELMPIAFQFV